MKDVFKPIRQYNRIRNMSIDEMAHEMTLLFYHVKDYTNAEYYIKQWLESEVEQK